MRSLTLWTAIVVLAAMSRSSAMAAQAGPIPREHHPWGRFEPGAWKRVCVVTETLDENGLVKIRSTRENTTTLTKVDEEGVTLRVDDVHEVAGKRFAAEPETIRQGFHGETLCEGLKLKESRQGQVVIEGRRMPCTVLTLESSCLTGKTVTEVYYCPTMPPYVLKRHSVTSYPDGKKPPNETTFEVVGFGQRCRRRPEFPPVALIKAVSKQATGTEITWAYVSTDVPGGIISHESQEMDNGNRLVRRSTLELIGYGAEPEGTQIGLFGRMRPARFCKPRTALRYMPQ